MSTTSSNNTTSFTSASTPDDDYFRSSSPTPPPSPSPSLKRALALRAEDLPDAFAAIIDPICVMKRWAKKPAPGARPLKRIRKEPRLFTYKPDPVRIEQLNALREASKASINQLFSDTCHSSKETPARVVPAQPPRCLVRPQIKQYHHQQQQKQKQDQRQKLDMETVRYRKKTGTKGCSLPLALQRKLVKT